MSCFVGFGWDCSPEIILVSLLFEVFFRLDVSLLKVMWFSFGLFGRYKGGF